MERVSKHEYYLDIAETVSERSTCLRRRFGAIIVKNDVIISTGYNGAPRSSFCVPSARRGDAKTAATSVPVTATSSAYRAVSDMKCAAAYIRRRTP